MNDLNDIHYVILKFEDKCDIQKCLCMYLLTFNTEDSFYSSILSTYHYHDIINCPHHFN